MTKTKLLLLALCTIALTGCGEPDSRGKIPTGNQPKPDIDYNVRFLFEADGVKVYRFYDREAGLSVYFTNANGNTSCEYTTTHRAGKSTRTRHHRVASINTADSITHDPDCPCYNKQSNNK